MVGQGTGSFDCVPPDEAPRAGIVIVRPEQELQPFDGELEIRREAVHGPGVALLESQLIRIEPQLDDQWPTAEPGRVQTCDDGLWL